MSFSVWLVTLLAIRLKALTTHWAIAICLIDLVILELLFGDLVTLLEYRRRNIVHW
jgi:hypothetical protein